MRTRVFWNHLTGERYELSEEDCAKRFLQPANGPTVLPDIDRAYGGGFVSPVDGTLITSRSYLRRHNATHQCRQAGDIKPGTLQANENRRVQQIREIANGKGVDFRWE